MSRIGLAIAACMLLAASPLAQGAQDDLPDEIRAEIEKHRPMVEEAQRIQDCLKPRMAERGLDLPQAFAQLDTAPDAAALRAAVLRVFAQDFAGDDAGRARVDAMPGVSAPLQAYVTRGVQTLDFPVVARSLSAAAVYLDRALGGPCHPNADILTFTGVPIRAD